MALGSPLILSETGTENLKEKLLATSKWLEKSTGPALNAKHAASDVRSKLQASEKKSKGLSVVLQVNNTALADHIAMVKGSLTLRGGNYQRS